MPLEFVPQGWAACDGAVRAVSENLALFSLLGNVYGGAAPNTFGLPKIPPLQGRKGMLQYCIAVQGRFPTRP